MWEEQAHLPAVLSVATGLLQQRVDERNRQCAGDTCCTGEFLGGSHPTVLLFNGMVGTCISLVPKQCLDTLYGSGCHSETRGCGDICRVNGLHVA